MSFTLIIWLILFAILAGLAFWRPVFGVSLYMLTYFLCPPFWWWGDPIKTYRWNLYSGVILLVAVILSGATSVRWLDKWSRRIGVSAALMALNATFVHFALADRLEISAEPYFLLVKFVLLAAMMVLAIRTKFDMRVAMLSILLGACYIGFEVTINGRGEIVGNRLEGVGAPSASAANQFASLLVTILPLAGVFFLTGNKWERLMMLPTVPFVVNTVLLCNSRGGNLAAVAGGIVFALAAPKAVRKKALIIVGIGALVTWMLLGDPRIVQRFMTIFNPADDRDASAQSRLEFAKAGIEMIKDYPLGAGGDAFKKVHGKKYLSSLGISEESHAIHNGFLNEACEWGLQGLALRLFMIGCVSVLLYQTTRSVAHEDLFLTLTGCALMAGLSSFLVTCGFGDRLDNEWGYWMVGLSVALSQVIHYQRSSLTHEEPLPG